MSNSPHRMTSHEYNRHSVSRLRRLAYEVIRAQGNSEIIHDAKILIRETQEEFLPAPDCPGCRGKTKMRNNPMHNCKSRYRDIIICNDCGTKEAFEGDHWGMGSWPVMEEHHGLIDRAWRLSWNV